MAVDGTSLDFKEQIDYLRRKVNVPTERWDDLLRGAHVRAWSVAGVTRDDLLSDIRAALERHNGDFESFKAGFDGLVIKAGWKPRGRGKTEEEVRAWRARVIYDTNIRTSYMAGRYQQMSDPEMLRLRPWWRYRHNYAKHPRKLHLEWDGLILAATNAWWRYYYPPNGWGCHCDVETLSDADLRRMGRSGPDEAPAIGAYEATDPRTGQTEMRLPGVDRGWEYNIGIESLDGPVPTELQAPLPPFGAPPAVPELPPMPPARQADASRILPSGLPEIEYVDAFLAEFGTHRDQPVLWRDATGGVITISPAMFQQRNLEGEVLRWKVSKNGREPYVRLIADAIRDPDEVWLDWAKNAAGTPVLRRTFISRLTLPDGRMMFARFEWSRDGWVGVTAYDVTNAYLARRRTGALLYRRKT